MKMVLPVSDSIGVDDASRSRAGKTRSVLFS
jgi:hypothetical protein